MTVNIPNNHTIHFLFQGPPNFTKSVWKQTIWQPWCGPTSGSFLKSLQNHFLCVPIDIEKIALATFPPSSLSFPPTFANCPPDFCRPSAGRGWGPGIAFARTPRAPPEKNGFASHSLHLAKRQPDQGCQMVCFQTKNPSLGKFWRALHRMENAGIFYGRLEYFTVIGKF
jgi:hypothetical protein